MMKKNKIVLNVNIGGKDYDLALFHTIVLKNINPETLKKAIADISSEYCTDIVNSEDYLYDFSALRKEMEERYYLIQRAKCKDWMSPELENVIEPKIVVTNLDYVRNEDLLDIKILFQSSVASGIYMIVGYSKRRYCFSNTFESGALKICYL